MLFLIALGYLNATGFCYRESRYLTNKQLISAAAIEAVKTNRAYAAIEQRIEYASATDLIARNPDCCIVIKDVGDQSGSMCGLLPAADMTNAGTLFGCQPEADITLLTSTSATCP